MSGGNLSYYPSGDPDPARGCGEAGVGEPAHGEEEEELGQVLQGVLVGPLDAVKHLATQGYIFFKKMIPPQKK